MNDDTLITVSGSDADVNLGPAETLTVSSGDVVSSGDADSDFTDSSSDTSENETVVEIGVSDITRRTSEIPTALFDVLWSNVGTVPIIRLLVVPGLYSWIMLACALFLWIKKKYYAMLPTLPLIINILICAASPMSSSPRYNLTTIALTPLIMWWTAIHVSSQVPAQEQAI